MHKNKPSITARKVALNIITLGAKPGMDKVLPVGIVEATAELLVASGAVTATTVRIARSPRTVAVYQAFDWMMPGQFVGFAHRKAFCEHQVRKGISAGARQVLVLGAGYDTLAWRLAPEFPKVNFFEIDHPATSSLKAKGIHQMGQRANLFLIAEDLGARRMTDVLSATKEWDPMEQTIMVAEGLLMYLSPAAVRELFVQGAAISATNSKIVFTYIPSGNDDRPYFGPWTGLLLWLLKVTGEPWLWSIRPQELDRFLEGTGWKNDPDPQVTAQKNGIEFFGMAKK